VKKFAVLVLAGALAIPSLAAAQSTDVSTLQRSAARACQAADRARLGFTGACSVASIERRALTGGVAEYSFRVRVGTGPFDVIGLHRVVRESAPFRPVRTRKSLFMAHGDFWGFDAAFLSDPQHALPLFLAQNGVDVWGIDFRWTLVPASTTDFTFMKSWSIDTDARDLGIGLTVARAVRLFSGDGFDRLDLLGWSRGGMIGYAYLDGESRLPRGLRNVGGFVPVDIYLKTDAEDRRQAACARIAPQQAQLAAGVYASQNGALVSTLGNLALTAPNDPVPPPLQPLFPGFTNRQAALVVGAATFLLADPVPFYHFTGGTFDAPSRPVDLLYTPVPAFFHFETGASPYQPAKELLDADISICDDPAFGDVTWDDHLDDITVPLLYVGAGGGFGEFGVYTTTLLGSADVTTHVVSIRPPAERLFDLGHADIFLSTDAQTRFWQPILTWLQTH
jgi:hypothetical protein